MKNMNIIFGLALFFAMSLHSELGFAQGKSPGTKKQMISVSMMALTSSTKQGGQGPSGSTVLSQSEYIYAWPNFGLGMFFQYDMQGESQKDTAYGPKLEAYWDPFFIELGYAVAAKRAFTDRTIADQTGSGTVFGLGLRFNIGAAGGAGGTGLFFHASYKYRTYQFNKQDGATITEPIQQTDGYPLLGLGYSF